eukprot:scaffold28455_cov47-Cyclotella_meneghiniana.AAC.1
MSAIYNSKEAPSNYNTTYVKLIFVGRTTKQQEYNTHWFRDNTRMTVDQRLLKFMYKMAHMAWRCNDVVCRPTTNIQKTQYY